MLNKNDIMEAMSLLLFIVVIMAVFCLGWTFSALLIAESCNWSQYFSVFNDTYTCSQVAP